MKKTLLLITAAAILFGGMLVYKNLSRKQASQAMLVSNDEEEEDRSDNVERAMREEFDLLKDPHTGKIPAGMREMELEQAKQIFGKQAALNNNIGARVQTTAYTYQGPANLGGRTRSIAFDVSDATSNTILAGGVSGGVFKTTNGGGTWTRVSPANQTFTVTSIAQDTRAGQTGTWYYVGGEALGNSTSENGAFYLGNGVYKSTDGGATWVRLANSNTGNVNSFDNRADLITKVVVNPANGDVYLGANGQIIRSQDGGATWVSVQSSASFTSSNQLTDVVITSTGRVYTAFSGVTSNGSDAVNGVWTSTTGNSGTYTRLSGTAAATNPAGWNAYGAYGRVVLAIAPSSENLVYALYDNFVVSNCSGTAAPEADFFRWDQTAGAWTDLSATLPNETGCSNGNDPFAVQGGYDLVIGVKPNDPNTVVIGGTNIYRSFDGGATWSRIGGYAGPTNYAQYANHHPDIHALIFKPNDPNRLISGDDGGIQSGDVTAGSVVWTPLNNNYQTYQYYHVAIKQEGGVNDFIGGAQDNGTTTGIGGSSTFSNILSGDGVAVGIGSGAAPYKQYCGFQAGPVYRRNSSLASGFIEANLTPSGVASIFVTYFFLDPDNTENLYYAGQVSGVNRLLRITNASTASSSSWQTFTFSFSGYIRAMAATRGTYTAASRLYLGTDNGKVYRLDDPVNAATSTAPVDITPTGMTGAGTVISIAVNPQNQNEILAVYSNYGVSSAWHTTTANSATPTWTNVEGNLSLPSYRAAIIVNNGAVTEYYVGTSVGLYKTAFINGASTTWSQEGASQIGNSVVTSLSLRTADNRFAIGTHGSGMWTGVVSFPLPVRYTDFTGTVLNNSSLLKWTTSSEERNKGFDVERSFDGVSFKKIGFIKGAGSTSSPTAYNFQDRDIAQDENFYRLKQLDLDDKPTYSNVILLRNRSAQSTQLTILQNPFYSHLDVQLPARQSKQLVVRLLDMSGKVIYNRTIASEQLKQRLDFDGISLTKGIYLLQITDGKKQYTGKVMKQ